MSVPDPLDSAAVEAASGEVRICDYCERPAAFATKEEQACEAHASAELRANAATAIAQSEMGTAMKAPERISFLELWRQREEARTALAEARASLERVKDLARAHASALDACREELAEAVARAEKAEIEVGRLQKILEQNTEWREGYAYGVSKLDEIAAPYKARAEKAGRERLQQWHEAQGWKARAEKAERERDALRSYRGGRADPAQRPPAE